MRHPVRHPVRMKQGAQEEVGNTHVGEAMRHGPHEANNDTGPMQRAGETQRGIPRQPVRHPVRHPIAPLPPAMDSAQSMPSARHLSTRKEHAPTTIPTAFGHTNDACRSPRPRAHTSSHSEVS